MELFLWILIIVLGYALGNLNGALLISKILIHDDVRTHGSGNAGLTNFFRTYGGFLSLLVIVIDVGKTVAACLIAQALLGPYGFAMEAKMVAGVAAILGHSYPAASQFKGGKGILSGAALAACLDWRVFAIIFSIFLLVVIFTRYVSLGSVLAGAAFSVSFCALYWGNWVICGLAVFAGAFVIVRHRANIGRLIHHNESKLSFHKKKE
ncbi:MAG TPA: glycerol-3-phosphate acyltransferase [Candidatus Avoscillospira avicola]|uniref:Glycerol-3-phosphate acyltransferase n=1 Tax=Candidatus Avoscillospira avicola TaxID=2840706 RepID=A0A9D1DJI2_9FIRM|nr:glycerol-3-phosphate acyltransferase [Candidatus Avoscillospira avicola]